LHGIFFETGFIHNHISFIITPIELKSDFQICFHKFLKTEQNIFDKMIGFYHKRIVNQKSVKILLNALVKNLFSSYSYY